MKKLSNLIYIFLSVRILIVFWSIKARYINCLLYFHPSSVRRYNIEQFTIYNLWLCSILIGLLIYLHMYVVILFLCPPPHSLPLTLAPSERILTRGRS